MAPFRRAHLDPTYDLRVGSGGDHIEHRTENRDASPSRSLAKRGFTRSMTCHPGSNSRVDCLSTDPNAGNIRVTADRVALIDWDESHVDVADLDLVLPHEAAGLDVDTLDIAAQASAA